jgi:flagellar biosynthesis component FlhA
MPQRSKTDLIPKEIRAELDKRIAEGRIANYRALAKWLNDNGCEICKRDAAHHGERLEHRLEVVKLATEQARAIAEASRYEEGAMSDALIRLVQQIDLDILLDLDSETVPPRTLEAISRSVASLARASVSQKKWMAGVRDKLNAEVGRAAEQVAQATRAGGLSPEAEQQIRNALLDIHV